MEGLHFTLMSVMHPMTQFTDLVIAPDEIDLFSISRISALRARATLIASPTAEWATKRGIDIG